MNTIKGMLSILCMICSQGIFAMSLTVQSLDFENNNLIPKEFTCQGNDLQSPSLQLSAIPKNTKALALIVDDPDASNGDWVHWVIFNMPASTTSLSSNNIPNGAINGRNSWGSQGYRGPCPPAGKHRYFFKLYALDSDLQLDSNANKQELLQAMQGHILEQGELIGLYQKI